MGCNNWFLEKESCNTHMLNCMIDITTLVENKIYKPAKKERVNTPIICDICQVNFSYVNAKKLHMKRKHTGSRKDYKCMICGKDFKVMADLTDHKKRVHSEKVPCSFCDFQSTQHQLKRHIQVIHLNQKNHVCDDCGKKFHEIVVLYKHKVSVHMKIKSFPCDNCEFVCGTVSNLNLHRSKIHKSKNNLSISSFKTSYKEIYNTAMSGNIKQSQ